MLTCFDVDGNRSDQGKTESQKRYVSMNRPRGAAADRRPPHSTNYRLQNPNRNKKNRRNKALCFVHTLDQIRSPVLQTCSQQYFISVCSSLCASFFHSLERSRSMGWCYRPNLKRVSLKIAQCWLGWSEGINTNCDSSCVAIGRSFQHHSHHECLQSPNQPRSAISKTLIAMRNERQRFHRAGSHNCLPEQSSNNMLERSGVPHQLERGTSHESHLSPFASVNDCRKQI